MTIGIDIDGVVANFAKRFSEVLRDIYGERVPLITTGEQILAWHWEDWCGLTKDEVEKGWEKLARTENFWETLDILDDEDFNALLSAYIESPKDLQIYFVTSRVRSKGNKVVAQTINWFLGKGLYNAQVISSNEKHVVAKALHFQYFIDDKLETCMEVKFWNPKCQVYIMDYPYNRVETPIPIKRVQYLREFLDDVRRGN